MFPIHIITSFGALNGSGADSLEPDSTTGADPAAHSAALLAAARVSVSAAPTVRGSSHLNHMASLARYHEQVRGRYGLTWKLEAGTHAYGKIATLCWYIMTLLLVSCCIRMLSVFWCGSRSVQDA